MAENGDQLLYGMLGDDVGDKQVDEAPTEPTAASSDHAGGPAT